MNSFSVSRLVGNRRNGLSLVARLSLVSAILPVAAFSASIQASGPGGPTACEIGNCAAPDSITNGQSVGGPIGFVYTLTNGDEFQFSGSYANSYAVGDSGVSLGFFPTATYIGNSILGNVASVGTDTVSLLMLQNIFDPGPGVWSGQYCETIPLTLGSNTSASGFVAFDGQALNTLNFTGPGSFSQSSCSNLTFTGTDNTGSTLSTAYTLTFTFDAGQPNGGSVSSTPEPASVFTFLFGAAGLTAVSIRKNLRRN